MIFLQITKISYIGASGDKIEIENHENKKGEGASSPLW